MKNNNVDKDIYNAPTVKESIKLASETPPEEFELELIQTLNRYQEWKKDNPGGSYDDFLNDMGIGRKSLKGGGLTEDY